MTNEKNAGRPHATMPISEDSGLLLYRAAGELRRLAMAATPGEWTYDAPENMVLDANTKLIAQPRSPALGIPARDANGYWIAAANPAEILRLLDALDAATAAQPIAPDFSQVAIGEGAALMRDDVKVADFRAALATHQPEDGAANDINEIIRLGFVYLDAAREAEPDKKWSFSHAGYKAMLSPTATKEASVQGVPEDKGLSAEVVRRAIDVLDAIEGQHMAAIRCAKLRAAIEAYEAAAPAPQGGSK